MRGACVIPETMTNLTRDFDDELRFFRSAGDKLKGRDDDGFLRFAWTASLAERSHRETTIEFNREFRRRLPPTELMKMERGAHQTLRAIAAIRASRGDLGDDAPPRLGNLVTTLESRLNEAFEWVQSRRRITAGNLGASRPVATTSRLMFICAVFPYLLRFKMNPRLRDEDGFYNEEGRWNWLRRWERALGHIRAIDDDWISRALHRGGLRAADLENGKFAEAKSLGDPWSWFRKTATRPDRWPEMILGAQIFIGWSRGLYKMSDRERERRWAQPLSAEEAKYKKVAVDFLKKHGVKSQFIRDQSWSFLGKGRSREDYPRKQFTYIEADPPWNDLAHQRHKHSHLLANRLVGI